MLNNNNKQKQQIMETQLEHYISSFKKFNLKTELIKSNDKQVLFIYHEDYFGNLIKTNMVFDFEGNDIKNYNEAYSITTI